MFELPEGVCISIDLVAWSMFLPFCGIKKICGFADHLTLLLFLLAMMLLNRGG